MTPERWRSSIRALLLLLDRSIADPADAIARDDGDEVRLPRALFLELLKRPPPVSAQATAVLCVMVARLEAAGRAVPELAELQAVRDDAIAEASADRSEWHARHEEALAEMLLLLNREESRGVIH
jgi:hypothetical protein